MGVAPTGKDDSELKSQQELHVDTEVGVDSQCFSHQASAVDIESTAVS